MNQGLNISHHLPLSLPKHDYRLMNSGRGGGGHRQGQRKLTRTGHGSVNHHKHRHMPFIYLLGIGKSFIDTFK